MPKLMSSRLAARLAPIAIVILVGLLAGCTRTGSPIAQPQLPLGGNAPADAPQQNDQVLRVTILNGKFDAGTYAEQSGATQLLVIATDGPYLFEIDRLVDRRELPAFGSTVVNYDTSTPGTYTMRAYLSTSDGTSAVADTAVLGIDPVGG